MAGSITISNTFALQAGPIPLSQLDTNFTQVTGALNATSTFSNYYADTGSANAIVVTVNSPQTFSYTTGITLDVKMAATNTGATIINVNGLGSKNVTTSNGSALSANMLIVGTIVTLKYDGTQFQVLGTGISYSGLNFNVTGSQIPANGIYLPSANTLGFSTNTTFVGQFDASGNLLVGNNATVYPSAGRKTIEVNGSSSSLVGLTIGAVAAGYLLNDGTNMSLVNQKSGSLSFQTSGGTSTLDASGNLGIDVTPSTWSQSKVIQLSTLASFRCDTATIGITNNGYYNGGWKYLTSTTASSYEQSLGAHTWNTAASGTAGNPITFTQAMTLDSGGNLLIGGGALGPSNINAVHVVPSLGLTLHQHLSGTVSGSGYAQFYYNGSQIGSIAQSGTTAVLYNTTSDQRLKTNISTASSASALIDSIQVRQFDWINDNSHQRYGMVAQELEAVVPEAVHTPIDPEEMMAIDYSKLVPLLVKEIQELRARVATLEAK